MVLAIYLLVDPTRSNGQLYAAVPRHHHVKLAKILVQLKIVGGYMRGQLITSLAITMNESTKSTEHSPTAPEDGCAGRGLQASDRPIELPFELS